jgi:hypothetical protein
MTGGFGPWAPGIDDSERGARWRAMAALGIAYLGAGHPFPRCCLAASRHDVDAELAWRALEALAPLPRRRLLSAYNALGGLRRGLDAAPAPIGGDLAAELARLERGAAPLVRPGPTPAPEFDAAPEPAPAPAPARRRRGRPSKRY